MPIRLSPKSAEGMMSGPCSWTFINATIYRFQRRSLSSNGFSRTMRPALLTLRKPVGARGLSVCTAEQLASRIASPNARASFDAERATAILG